MKRISDTEWVTRSDGGKYRIVKEAYRKFLVCSGDRQTEYGRFNGYYAAVRQIIELQQQDKEADYEGSSKSGLYYLSWVYAPPGEDPYPVTSLIAYPKKKADLYAERMSHGRFVTDVKVFPVEGK